MTDIADQDVAAAPVAFSWGPDQLAAVKDPSGNVWYIGTRVEDVSSEEMRERMKKQGLIGYFPNPIISEVAS